MNGITIAIKTADFGSIRGYTLVACILEEMAFWGSEDSAQPPEEILRAIKPAMSTIPNSLSICISTPYSKSGLLWELYRRFYSKPGDLFFWKSPSLVLNPTLDKKLIKAAFKDDRIAALSEWESEFRGDISGFISLDALEKCIVTGRHELPPYSAVNSYVAFTDPSGGSSDSFTLCIGHNENGKVVIDCLREARPPFQPSQIVREFSSVIQSYGLSTVTGDIFGGEWVAEAFRNCNIHYLPAERNKNQLYLALLPILMNGEIELLDNALLVSQLTGLERRARSGGRAIVDHGPGGHDDVANVVAGAAVLCHQSKQDFRLEASYGISESYESEEEKMARDSVDWLLGRIKKKKKLKPGEVDMEELEAEMREVQKKAEEDLRNKDSAKDVVLQDGWDD